MMDQAVFRAGLLDPRIATPDGLVDGQGRPAQGRYSVYRNNVTHSLVEALKTAFPLVRGLIGAQNFDSLAPHYVRAHPPSSPLLMFYGDDFPTFLTSIDDLSHIGYLPDAARLDLGMRHSYHAADVPVFDPGILQDLSPDALMDSILTLTPACRIIRSPWPLFDIWRFNTVTDAPKPRAIAQDVLITRPEFDPMPHLLPPGGAVWLDHLAGRHPFGAAVEAASLAQPDFDLSDCLTLLLHAGAIAEVSHKELT